MYMYNTHTHKHTGKMLYSLNLYLVNLCIVLYSVYTHFLYTQSVILRPPPRNYYVSPLSSDQFRAVMGYIRNVHNGSLDKIKPQGELQGQAHNRGGLKRS